MDINAKLTAALLLVICCQPQASAQAGLEKAAATITEADLKQDLEFLASDEMRGRNTPSPELDQAAAWISKRFADLGLEPAFQGSWLQGRLIGDQARARGSLKLGDQIVTLGSDQIRVAGSGMLAGRTLEVVILPIPRRRSEVPPEEGLAGRAVLFTSTPTISKLQPRARTRVVRSAMRWMRSRKVAAYALPPELHIDPRSLAGGAAPVIFLDEPPAPRETESPIVGSLTLDIPLARKPLASNVGGFIRGSDPKLAGEVIAFSAHYDHIGVRRGEGDVINNGADDDGSGTVSVMAIARAMKALKKPPARTTLFLLFYGEEKGLLGSKYYCDHPALPLRSTRALFNIEMVGRPDDIGPNCAWITGWNHSNFGELIVPAGKAFGIRFYENKKRGLSKMLFGASDNRSFAVKGVPAHSISAGSLHKDYHRPSDETDKIDFKNMTRVVRAIFAAGATMADRGPTPNWYESSRHAEAGRKLRDSGKK